ncbi:MAG TPA: hypothetical protein VGR56_06305 [Nitrososphaerales archaeon]|nr:hypothetical protein [Nitrososphaerales archaeon]
MAGVNYYLELDGSPTEVSAQAMRWLLGSSNQVVYLAVIQNGIIENAFRDSLGQSFVRSMIGQGSALLNGHQVVLVTRHKKLYLPVATRLLALYPDRAFLDELDALPLITEILAVSWVPEDIKGWRTTRNAAPLGQAQTARTQMHLSDRVVEAAILTLDSEVNRANGLVGGRDKETAIQIFGILRRAGLEYDPDEIKAFLISERGWEAPLAERARFIASEILRGRRLRGGTPHFVSNILDIWRGKRRGTQPPRAKVRKRDDESGHLQSLNHPPGLSKVVPPTLGFPSA